jgi:hypothetical protein
MMDLANPFTNTLNKKPAKEGKPKPKRSKRTTLALDDGWSIVTHSSPSRKTTSRQNAKTDEQLRSARPAEIVAGMTVEKLLAEFKDMQRLFRESECAEQMRVILKRRNWDLKNAVCLAVGSLSRDWEHRKRGLWQLALFFSVIETISPNNQSLGFWAQDPEFNALDIEFLEALGFTVLENTAQEHITETSFAYAPFLDWQVLLPEILKDRDPGLYIGNEILEDYTQYGYVVRTSDGEGGDRARDGMVMDCNAIGSRFLEGRKRVDIPRFEGHELALAGLVGYWKE